MTLGRFRIGFHRHGNCWRLWKLYRNTYYAGDMTVRGWWRFYLVTDNRLLAVA